MGRFFALICLGLNTITNTTGYDNDDRHLLNTYRGPCTIQNVLYASTHLL